jgi:hypothetical protein
VLTDGSYEIGRECRGEDKVNHVPDALADAFCVASDGGGYSTSSLYSDNTGTLLEAQRPAIISGIDDILRRSDVIDRCLVVRPPSITDEARLLELSLWTEFRADWPVLLGSVLMAVSGGLRMLPEVHLSALARMADFARWGEAVMRGLGWEPGSFLDRYDQNRRAACHSALQGNEIAQALVGMMESAEGIWRGTATELLQKLASHARQCATRSGRWPQTAHFLSVAIRRIQPQLRTVGISVDFDLVDNTRMITISRTDGRPSAAVPAGGQVLSYIRLSIPSGVIAISATKKVRQTSNISEE